MTDHADTIRRYVTSGKWINYKGALIWVPWWWHD